MWVSCPPLGETLPRGGTQLATPLLCNCSVGLPRISVFVVIRDITCVPNASCARATLGGGLESACVVLAAAPPCYHCRKPLWQDIPHTANAPETWLLYHPLHGTTFDISLYALLNVVTGAVVLPDLLVSGNTAPWLWQANSYDHTFLVNILVTSSGDWQKCSIAGGKTCKCTDF